MSGMGSARNSQFPQFLDIMLIVQCADHLIGSPLALASESYSAKAWQKFEGIPALQIPTISWTQGSAIKVDSSKKTATISDSKSGEQYEEKYDYLIAASGLRRVWPVSPQSTTREKYLPKASSKLHQRKLSRIASKQTPGNLTSCSLNFPASVPNASHHFAVGDVVAWSGIKRCGGAMAMGHSAAVNIHQQMLRSHFGTEPRPNELEEYPPMIALAVGKTAVVYNPQSGTRAGEEWMARFFGENLGLESKFESAGV
jgi:NADH dehydrogenase FAD-containing subunit